MDKSSLREIVKERIKVFERREKESLEIVEKIRSLDEYKKAKVVLAYSALFDEVDLSPLFKDDKIFLFPYIEGEDIFFAPPPLKEGKFHIAEPINKEEFPHDNALILVPGRAFDKKCHRLGRGKGYYDRYLKKNKNKLYSIGIGFSVQIFDEIPFNEFDEALDLILSGGV